MTTTNSRKKNKTTMYIRTTCQTNLAPKYILDSLLTKTSQFLFHKPKAPQEVIFRKVETTPGGISIAPNDNQGYPP